jgi:hypothetical protein
MTEIDEAVGRVARAAAGRLAGEFGAELGEDVEVILRTGEFDRRSGQYFDPISLASLVVSVSSFAWTVYWNLRQKGSKPKAEVVARRVRVELPVAAEHDKIIEVVVEEILKEDG